MCVPVPEPEPVHAFLYRNRLVVVVFLRIYSGAVAACRFERARTVRAITTISHDCSIRFESDRQRLVLSNVFFALFDCGNS